MKHLLLLLTFIYTSITFAQTWQQTGKIVASDRATDDYFGFSGVVHNNQLIVGAYGNNPTGFIYVFDKINGNWVETQRMNADDAAQFDELGRRIVVDNNILLVSDYNKNNGSLYDTGAVYVYNKDTAGLWVEQQKLIANTPREYGNFGLETGIHNNTLVVGSDYGDVNVFEYNDTTSNWDFAQELLIEDGNGLTSDAAVDTNSTHIVVGLFDFDETEIENTGAAYIFVKGPDSGQWNQVQKILSPDFGIGQRFGKKVFFHDSFLFIASVEWSKVYVYKYNTTTYEYDYNQTLGGASGFGQAIDAENNTLVIGSYRHSYTVDGSTSSIPQTGSFSTFTLVPSTSLWSFDQTVKHSDPGNYDWLGSSISIDNEVILAGAPYQDTDENSLNDKEKAGASYIFELDTNLSTSDVFANEFSVYPNPTRGMIQFSNFETFSKVDVINITGQLVKTFNSNFETLSIADLVDGIYILKISTKNNSSMFKKIIKKD